MSQLDLKFWPTDLLAKLAGRHVVASISGGRDSAAMGLLLKELGIEHSRLFMNTQWESPITIEYVQGPLQDALGPITEIAAEMGFLDLVKHKGLFPSRVMRFCTTELKVLPAQRFLNIDDEAQATANEIVNAVGIRRAESKARSEMTEWEWSDGFDCEIWRPLVTWTAADVEAIHARHGLAMSPLYGMGARRVGCWPCIHASKQEIALVARVDPDRIALIDATERQLNDLGSKRDIEKGREFVPRSMFSYGGGGRKHIPLPIYQAVEWANSKRGEWHPPGAGDGCMRHGLCETAEDS